MGNCERKRRPEGFDFRVQGNFTGFQGRLGPVVEFLDHLLSDFRAFSVKVQVSGFWQLLSSQSDFGSFSGYFRAFSGNPKWSKLPSLFGFRAGGSLGVSGGRLKPVIEMGKN